MFRQENTTCPPDVTYEHRVDDSAYYDWCVVPNSGYDSILFAGVALVAACLLQGKFASLYVMAAGALCQTVAFPLNMGRFGNSLAIWLGIRPADLLLYTFLPPMLLDAAMRIDFFLFSKVLVHVTSFAFLLVIASTAMLVPVLLFGFDLIREGWQWPHAALFGAVMASTDAVAVSSLLKSAGAPEHLIVIMEGESLFNDATSIVLFEIFFEAVQNINNGKPAYHGDVAHQGLMIVKKILRLATGGAIMGLIFGVLTRFMLKLMHRRGHKAPEQLALTVAMAYLCFYVANAPMGVSGVIAVVVFGLYGCATAKWHMSAKIVETGVFDSFWDTVGFAMNGVVFFFAGASSVNFFWRSSEELLEHEPDRALIWSFWRLPLIWLVMILVRAICILILNPMFRLAGTPFSMAEVVFSSIGGLRGAISLILAQMLVTEHRPGESHRNSRVTAQLVLWTAGVVVLTLIVNAPIIPGLVGRLGLLDIPLVKRRMRAKAARALLRFSRHAVHDLQADPDEMLRGVDWREVHKQTDLTHTLAHLLMYSDPLHKDPSERHHRGSKEMPEGTFKRTLQKVKIATIGSMDKDYEQLEPLLDQQTAEDGTLHDDLPHAHDTDALHAAQPHAQEADDEQKGRQSDDYDQLEVPFLKEMRKPGKKGKKQGGEQHDEENPPRRRQQQAEQESAPHSGQHAQSRPLTSPFAQPPPGQQQPPEESAADQPGTVQHPPGHAHTILAPPLVPPGETAHHQHPSVHWASVDWTAEGSEQDRNALHGRNSQRRLSRSYSRKQTPSTDAKRQAEARMLTRAISGLFSDPERRQEAAQDAAIGSMGEGEGEEDDEEERLFNQQEMTEEARLRLVAGLKRYYHGKRAEGLLSAKGMQLLDWVCAAQMDQAGQPLSLWSQIEKEACGHMRVKMLSQALFWGRKLFLRMRCLRPRWLFLPLTWPISRILNLMSAHMSRVMLLAIEVAVEFWLSLQWSPQAQWLRDADTPSGSLRDEVKQQTRQVWNFILDREVEAPARFCAIQTHRATIAAMYQQASFVEQLYKTGMVDEGEKDMLSDVIDRQLRRLGRRGPQWRVPLVVEVLRGMPALQGLPNKAFDQIVGRGRLVRYNPDQVIWTPPQDTQHAKGGGIPCRGTGIFVVVVGLVKWTYAPPGQPLREFFVGCGDVLGLLPSLVGEVMPGNGPAVAVGNALGHGPIVFHLPQSLIDDVRSQAQSDVAFKQLELDLHRVASLFVLDRAKGQVRKAALAHYQHIALMRTRKALLKRIGALQQRRLGRPAKASEIWSAVRRSEAAQKIVARELEHALRCAGGAPPEDAAQEEEAGQGWQHGQSEEGAVGGPAGEPTDEELLLCIDPKAVTKILQGKATQALNAVREHMRDASLVRLEPYGELSQQSSLVVLRGSLRTSGRAAATSQHALSHRRIPSGEAAPGPSAEQPHHSQAGADEAMGDPVPKPPSDCNVRVQFHGPCVLPWLWEGIHQNGDLLLTPQPITYVAGHNGAVVMVCPPPAAEDDTPRGEESESSAALDSRLQQENEAGASGEGEGQQDSSAFARLATGQGFVAAQRLPSGGPAGAVEFGGSADSPSTDSEQHVQLGIEQPGN